MTTSERVSKKHAVQAKLSVNTPGDAYEREAEHVANAVTAASGEGTLRLQAEKPSLPASTGGIARRHAISARPAEADVSQAVDPVVRGDGGSELDPSTRTFMESRFGHDFSQVRIHANSDAAASAHSIGARAYTLGNHVVFGDGQYAPHTSAGRHLLAHELTHVVQQGGAAADGVVQRAGEVVPAPNWSPNAKITFDPHADVTLDDGRAFGTWFPGNPNGKIDKIRLPKNSSGQLSMTAKAWWVWDHPSFTTKFGCIVVSTDVRFKVDAYGKIEFSTQSPQPNISNDSVGQITAKGFASAAPGTQFGGFMSLTAAIEAGAQINLTQGSNTGTQTTKTRSDENSVETSVAPEGMGVKAGGKVATSTANTTSGGTTTSYGVTLVGAGGWNRTYGLELEVEGVGERRGEMVSVYFQDEGLTTLSDEGVGLLQMFAKNLPQQPRNELLNGTNHLMVYAHASVTGNNTTNKAVAGGRAASVKNAILGNLDFLKSKPEAVLVDNRGKGEADQTSKEPKANDRRCDIEIWWTEGVQSVPEAPRP